MRRGTSPWPRSTRRSASPRAVDRARFTIEIGAGDGRLDPPILALRRGGLPLGALTIIFGINTVFMSVLSDEYRLIPGALIVGAVSDLVVRQLRPSAARPIALRIVAFFVPASYFATYLGTLALGRGVGWSIHLWAGSVVLAGCVGLLLAYVLDESARRSMRMGEPTPAQS